MLSYLGEPYGKLGFIVTRDESASLVKGVELDHFLEIYNRQEKTMIVKLTGKFLCSLLSKLRNPLKHDEPDNLMHRLLDTYSRMYLSGQSDVTHKRKKASRQPKRKSDKSVADA